MINVLEPRNWFSNIYNIEFHMWTVSWFYRKICGYMGENEDCDSKYYKQLLMQLIFFFNWRDYEERERTVKGINCQKLHGNLLRIPYRPHTYTHTDSHPPHISIPAQTQTSQHSPSAYSRIPAPVNTRHTHTTYPNNNTDMHMHANTAPL